MDPAALLDPRGARRRQVAQQNSRPTPMQTFQQQQYVSPQFQPQPQQFQQAPQFQFAQQDPRALLNPQQIKRPASDPATAEPGRGRHAEPSQPGQYSLVERLYNVHERTASPAKRVKTDETNEAKNSNSKSLHHGSGVLDIGNGKQQAPTQTKAPAIDLTMSDDDDVQCMQDNSNQVICIGRPKQLYVQSHMVPFPDPKKYPGNSGIRARIKVSFRRAAGSGHQGHNKIMVVDPTGKEFGRVDSVSAQHLAPLMDASNATGLLWQAWTEPRNRNQNDGPPGSPSSALIGLTMQLYCPRKNAHNIGQYLLARKVALAAPMWDLSRYDYFNPQTHESMSRDVAEQPGYVPTVQQYAPGVGSSYVMRSVDEIRSDVQNMFDTMINSEEIAEREPSPLVLTKLYKHQKQALWFMWHKEQDLRGEKDDQQKDSLWQPKHRNNGQKYYVHVITGEERATKPLSCQGGILADEMGLGKTLSILSLVADTDSMAAARQFGSQNPAPSRENRIQPQVNSRATLLVCPLSTMYNWKSQLEVHFPRGEGGLKWANYHGKSRSQFSVKELADHDLVITTYHMIQADFLNTSAILPHINWFRIVLDEAHTIRNANTKQSIAACSLAAQRRWAVTGTPVQNRLEDLGALFKFLHLHPFSTQGFNQHILIPFKNADPDVVPKLQLLVSSVTLRRVKKNVLEVEIPPRKDSIVRLRFSKDEQRLHDWFESDSARKVNAVTSGDKLGGHSYARILTAITNLRLICAHGRDLLSDEALKMTDGMTYDNPVELDDDGADSGPPELSRAQAYDMLDLLESMGNDQCQYCRENICHADNSDDEDEGGNSSDTLGWMTPCYQVVCAKHAGKLSTDLSKNLQADGLVLCPFCPTRIRPAPFKISLSDFNMYLEERDRNRRNPKLAKKMGGYTGPSTKTQALLEDLAQHKAWSDAHPDEPPIKSVVFSTWTTHLDLIQLALENHRFKYVRLDGRMPREARNRSLTAFDNDNDVHIILVSIGAGGLGLNLTKANKAFVMEPQFNPAAEAQAVDRVHRLGQTRPVEIKRFIMEGSFEEKMLELQRKKMELADLTMSREKGSKEQAAKQRLEDLRSLFK